MIKLVSGIIATIFSVTMTIPQIYKTLKTKKTEDLSIQSIILAICCNTAWIIYAITNNFDVPLLITTSLLNLQQTILLIAKIKYK